MITDISRLESQIQNISKTIPDIDKSKLSKDKIIQIYSYVTANKESWNQLLNQKQTESLFLRKGSTHLPYSIEYWKNGQCFFYTDVLIGQGMHKNVFLAAELTSQSLVARVKPFSNKEDLQDIIQEGNFLNSFVGSKGIVNAYGNSYYPSKKNSALMKYHMLQTLYECDLEYFLKNKIQLEEDDLKKMISDLLMGLAAIHNKGLLHEDLKPKNILIKFDRVTNKISEAALCDLGMTSSGHYYKSSEEKETAQKWEVYFILRRIQVYAKIYEIEIPQFIHQFIDNLNEQCLVSAEKALEKLEAWVPFNSSEKALEKIEERSPFNLSLVSKLFNFFIQKRLD